MPLSMPLRPLSNINRDLAAMRTNRIAWRWADASRRHWSLRPRLAAAQSGIFLANADPEDNGIEERENRGEGHETEGKRQDKDFSGHDAIVGMAQKTVGAGGDQWRTRHNNNSCSPPLAKAGQHPKPCGLQQCKKQQERRA